MKKLSLILLFIIVASITASAENLVYNSTHYSQQYLADGKWGKWSDWESCNVKIDIDLDKDIVTIYSSRKQIYNITEFVGKTENEGDVTLKFLFIDQDGDKGTLRLLMRNNGRSEIYIDFANIRWAYIVKRV